jgi:hypothetical protein
MKTKQFLSEFIDLKDVYFKLTGIKTEKKVTWDFLSPF